MKPLRHGSQDVPDVKESGIQLTSQDAVPRLYDEEITDVSSTTALIIPASRREDARPRLMLMSGASAGKVISLPEDKKRFVVGRVRTADVRIEDTGVSRLHCRIIRGDEGRLFIQDLGSRNGTYVNGQRIVCVPLNTGDRIQLGPAVVVQVGLFDETETALAQTLYEASTRDPITRLFNRRYFDQRVVGEMSHARRHGSDLIVMRIDLDRFKEDCERHGQAAGDEILRGFASSAIQCLRVEDVLSRYGGAEFVLLVRDTPMDRAIKLAERIHTALDKVQIPFGRVTLRLPTSIGLASLAEFDPDASVDDLLQLAHSRLCRAKAEGRSHVCPG